MKKSVPSKGRKRSRRQVSDELRPRGLKDAEAGAVTLPPKLSPRLVADKEAVRKLNHWEPVDEYEYVLSSRLILIFGRSTLLDGECNRRLSN